jgi:hypothetical protein
MNQTFSFGRFSLLVKNHWAENKKKYLLSIPAFMGLLLLWFLFILLTKDWDPMAEGIQQVTYFFSLFGLGIIYASQFFGDLGSRPKAINYLMVPASTLEKFLCSLLYSTAIFFAVFTIGFYIVDVLMVGIANATNTGYNEVVSGKTPLKATITNVFYSREFAGNKGWMSFYFFLMFLTVQSAYLLGSVYFPKYSFIKTTISQLILMLVFFLLIYFLNESVMPNGGYHNGLTSYRIERPDQASLLVRLPQWLEKVLKYLLMYGLPPLLWLVTYHRLKEKQV